MLHPDDDGLTRVGFRAGKATATVNVATVDDTVAEDDSTITATIVRDTDYAIGTPGAATVTANDNDLPTISIQPETTPVTEGDIARFTIGRTGSTAAALTVDLTVNETGDMLDVNDEGSASFTIPAGKATATLDVATVDDTVAEDDSTITVTVATSTEYVIGTPGSATITTSDNDP